MSIVVPSVPVPTPAEMALIVKYRRELALRPPITTPELMLQLLNDVREKRCAIEVAVVLIQRWGDSYAQRMGLAVEQKLKEKAPAP